MQQLNIISLRRGRLAKQQRDSGNSGKPPVQRARPANQLHMHGACGRLDARVANTVCARSPTSAERLSAQRRLMRACVRLRREHIAACVHAPPSVPLGVRCSISVYTRKLGTVVLEVRI